LDENVQDNATEIDVPVQYIVPHPEYSRDPYINDIALMRLSTPVKSTSETTSEFLATAAFLFAVHHCAFHFRIYSPDLCAERC